MYLQTPGLCVQESLPRLQPPRSSGPPPTPPREGKGGKGSEYLWNGNISPAALQCPEGYGLRIGSETLCSDPSPPHRRCLLEIRGLRAPASYPLTSRWLRPSLCTPAESARASPGPWSLGGSALPPAGVPLAVSPGSNLGSVTPGHTPPLPLHLLPQNG